MRISALLLAALLGLVSGCQTLSPVRVASEITPAKDDPNGGYLVGVIGVSPDSKFSAINQSLFIRKRGTDHTAQAYMMDNWMIGTKREKQGDSKVSYFAIPLMPGDYEIYNFRFLVDRTTLWKKEDFSVPLRVEPGKAYYVGDYRSNCFAFNSRLLCNFLRSDNLAQDSVKLRQEYPYLPDIESLEVNLQDAYPLIRNRESAQGLLERMQGKNQ